MGEGRFIIFVAMSRYLQTSARSNIIFFASLALLFPQHSTQLFISTSISFDQMGSAAENRQIKSRVVTPDTFPPFHLSRTPFSTTTPLFQSSTSYQQLLDSTLRNIITICMRRYRSSC
ncbi:hypothetical protein N431DRAFT_164310 [Stipitochalara longipes BDJ]|nr:hypothetical protein N431DRAFT_164310 [Stipitochalara longipes BDJ]